MPYLGVKPADEFSSKDLNGEQLILDADADTTITADTDDTIDIRIAGADDFQFTANKFLVQTGSNLDMNGTELILDADADTSITADTDDQIDFKIAGADDFRMTANTLSVLSGTTLNIDSGATIANSGTATGFGANTAVDSITAGSTQTQAGATALTGTFNRVTVSGTNGDGVKLPAAVAGLEVTIDNADAAQTIDVWPATGNKIEGGSDNAVDPTSIQFGTSRTYFCVDGDNWRRNIPPGTVLQKVLITTTSSTGNTDGTEVATGLTGAISLLDTGSKVRVAASGSVAMSRAANAPTVMQGTFTLWRTAIITGTALQITKAGKSDVGNPASPDNHRSSMNFLTEDAPATKSATTYVVGVVTDVSTNVLATFNSYSTTCAMILEEIAT